MWNGLPLKYFEGAKPGVKKRKSEEASSSNESAKSKKYEEYRKERSMSESWKNGREWLHLDFVNKVMTCTYCIDASKSSEYIHPNLKNVNTFVTGCTNMRYSSITDHEKSKVHLRSSEAAKAKIEPVRDSNAGKALLTLKSAEKNKLCILFQNVHAIAKNNRPLSDYTWLCSIDVAKGLDIGSTYVNEKAALSFLNSIAGVEKINTQKMLQQTPFFSFMMDGSTDIAGDEQEVIFVRFSTDGQVTERFLSIGTPDSSSSEHLFDHLMETFDCYGVEKAKLVGMGSDGASNMVGIRTGLSARLRNEVSTEIINIHCLCHRLELSFRDVVKSSNNYDKTMTLLIGLHYFYRRQYKNKAGLERSIKMIGKGVMPPKVTGTRWLPHLSRGLSSLMKTFQALEAHLSTASHGNPKAEGLLKIMLNRNTMAFMLFLQMVTEPLMKLSLKLQRTESTLADCLMWVEATVEILQELEEKKNVQLEEVLTQGTFQGIKLKGPVPQMAYRGDVVTGLVEAIDQRFGSLGNEKNVIAATKVLSLKNWPNEPDSLKDFGNDEIEAVCQHFSSTLVTTKPAFSAEDAILEWGLLKKITMKKYGKNLATTQWEMILADKTDFQNISLVIDLMLALPPTSVSCETSFSQMKLIKTCRRTRLRNTTLNNLILVKLESPDIGKFQPEEAVEMWLTDSTSTRRPTYQRRPNTEKQDEQGVVMVSDEPDDEDTFDLDDSEELDYINGLLGEKMDDFDVDFQDEDENTAKLMMYMRESE